MAVLTESSAATKADLEALTPPDGYAFTIYGNSAIGDIAPLDLWYDASSTATDTGTLDVITPTARIGLSGRYLKRKRSYNDLVNQPSIPSSQQAYQGTTKRQVSFPFFDSKTVASGVATFQLTADGLSTGTALFPNGVIEESINCFVSDATASYQMSYALTNSNKTLTVTANKLTTANILTGILGQAQANGSVVRLQVWGY